MAKILLRVVTLDKICFEQEVDMVVLDVVDGQIGILPGHAPLTVGLRENGILRGINGEEEHVFDVAGGFAKISADSVVILTESAQSAG